MINAAEQAMKAIARSIDNFLNGSLNPKKFGFVVLVFEFENKSDNRVNYISNCSREDVSKSLQEITARFNGKYSEDSSKTKRPN